MAARERAVDTGHARTLADRLMISKQTTRYLSISAREQLPGLTTGPAGRQIWQQAAATFVLYRCSDFRHDGPRNDGLQKGFVGTVSLAN
jgi:hypothetical protein